MAKKESGPVELGAEMDYAEHDATYNVFMIGAKYGTLICVVLLIAMAVGFYTGAGFLGGLATFVISFLIGRKLMNLVL